MTQPTTLLPLYPSHAPTGERYKAFTLGDEKLKPTLRIKEGGAWKAHVAGKLRTEMGAPDDASDDDVIGAAHDYYANGASTKDFNTYLRDTHSKDYIPPKDTSLHDSLMAAIPSIGPADPNAPAALANQSGLLGGPSIGPPQEQTKAMADARKMQKDYDSQNTEVQDIQQFGAHVRPYPVGMARWAVDAALTVGKGIALAGDAGLHSGIPVQSINNALLESEGLGPKKPTYPDWLDPKKQVVPEPHTLEENVSAEAGGLTGFMGTTLLGETVGLGPVLSTALAAGAPETDAVNKGIAMLTTGAAVALSPAVSKLAQPWLERAAGWGLPEGVTNFIANHVPGAVTFGTVQPQAEHLLHKLIDPNTPDVTAKQSLIGFLKMLGINTLSSAIFGKSVSGGDMWRYEHLSTDDLIRLSTHGDEHAKDEYRRRQAGISPIENGPDNKLVVPPIEGTPPKEETVRGHVVNNPYTEASDAAVEAHAKDPNNKLAQDEWAYRQSIRTAGQPQDTATPSPETPPMGTDAATPSPQPQPESAIPVTSESVQPPVAPVDGLETLTPEETLPDPSLTAKLPKELAGAKPRYKEFQLRFTSHLDLAAYILGAVKKSKRDADYRLFLLNHDFSEEDIQNHYIQVKKTISDLIKTHEGDDKIITVPNHGRPEAKSGQATDLPSTFPENRVVGNSQSTSPREIAAVRGGTEGKTLVEAAKWLRKAAPSRMTKIITAMLLPKLMEIERLRGHGGKVIWEPRTNGSEYNPETHNIIMDETLGARTLLHELVHGVTASYIHAVRGRLPLTDKNRMTIRMTKGQVRAVEDLYKLFEHVRSFMPENPSFSVDYMLTSAHELLAEGFSSPEAREFLQNLPSREQGLFPSRFVSLICRILGVPLKADSAFAELYNITERIGKQEGPEESETRRRLYHVTPLGGGIDTPPVYSGLHGSAIEARDAAAAETGESPNLYYAKAIISEHKMIAHRENNPNEKSLKEHMDRLQKALQSTGDYTSPEDIAIREKLTFEYDRLNKLLDPKEDKSRFTAADKKVRKNHIAPEAQAAYDKMLEDPTYREQLASIGGDRTVTHAESWKAALSKPDMTLEELATFHSQSSVGVGDVLRANILLNHTIEKVIAAGESGDINAIREATMEGGVVTAGYQTLSAIPGRSLEIQKLFQTQLAIAERMEEFRRIGASLDVVARELQDTIDVLNTIPKSGAGKVIGPVKKLMGAVERYYLRSIFWSPMTLLKKTLTDTLTYHLNALTRLEMSGIHQFGLFGVDKDPIKARAIRANLWGNTAAWAMGRAKFFAAYDPELPMGEKFIEDLDMRGAKTKSTILRAADPLRALQGITMCFHQVFREQHLQTKYMELALREGRSGEDLKNRIVQLSLDPPQRWVTEADRIAAELTYQEQPYSKNLKKTSMTGKQMQWDTMLTARMQEEDSILQMVQGAQRILPFRLLIPAAKFGYNITKSSLRNSPLGIFSRRNIVDIASGGDARAATIARMATGTILTGAAMGLMQAGKVTGAYPEKSEERAYWKDKKWLPFSINIHGVSIPMNKIQPFGMYFTVLASAKTAFEDNKFDRGNTITHKLIYQLAHGGLDATFYDGFKNLVDACEKDEAQKQVAKMVAANFIPNVVGDFRNLADPVKRQPHSLLETLENKVPGLSQRVPEARDSFGDVIQKNPVVPEEHPTVGGVVGNTLARVGNVSKYWVENNDDPLVELMAEIGYSPKQVYGTFKDRDLRQYELSGDQKSAYLIDMGAAARRSYELVYSNPKLSSLPEETKRIVLKRILTKQVAPIGKIYKTLSGANGNAAQLQIEKRWWPQRQKKLTTDSTQ